MWSLSNGRWVEESGLTTTAFCPSTVLQALTLTLYCMATRFTLTLYLSLQALTTTLSALFQCTAGAHHDSLRLLLDSRTRRLRTRKESRT